MTKGDSAAPARLATISRDATAAGQRGLPPVHLWNPAFCGDIDMRVASDGTWFYMGSPIGRPAMVRLFSTILRKDPARYVLVTPVERVGIQVDDLPFLAVSMSVPTDEAGAALVFRTLTEDEARVGPDHALRFDRAPDGGLKPAVHIRGDLWARLSRPLLYELVERGVEHEVDGVRQFGVWSSGVFFPICPATEIDSL